MERILVTGVTGFIGSELARKLVELGYEVYGLVRETSNVSSLDPIRDIINQMHIKRANLTDYVAVRKLVTDIAPHKIVHVGAMTAVRSSFELPIEFNETNYIGTINLAQAALQLHSFDKFIFASTMETYGFQESHVPFKEDLPPNPGSPYAVSKVACEYYLRTAAKAFGLPYLISRCCNTYGRKNQTGFVTEYIATQMLRGETVYIGTPNAVRDMMYVDDHINAYVTLIKSKEKNEAFNFGTGNQMPMKEIAEKLKAMTGFKGDIIHTFPPNYPSRPVVEEFLSLDATKAKEKLGWTPKYSVEEGLKKTVEYWKEKLKK